MWKHDLSNAVRVGFERMPFLRKEVAGCQPHSDIKPVIVCTVHHDRLIPVRSSSA